MSGGAIIDNGHVQCWQPPTFIERCIYFFTVPKRIRDLQQGVGWRRCPNGGGWISASAYVDSTSYVDKNAVVYGCPRIVSYSCIEDTARVCGVADLLCCFVGGDAVVHTGRHIDKVIMIGQLPTGETL